MGDPFSIGDIFAEQVSKIDDRGSILTR